MSDAQQAERDRELVFKFVERFASHLADAGMHRMAARVFVALLCQDDGRMTAADLAEGLQVSPAAVSGAVRYLNQANMLGREREPGSRRDNYVLLDNLWYDMVTRREALMTRWQPTIEEGLEALGEDTPAGLRWKETLAFFEYLHVELPKLMDNWRVRRAELHREWGPAE